MFELLDDRAPQPARQRADGEPREHVVEEPEHDQAFGFGRRDAARLEVVELVVVDRSDGRCVRAAHVVGFDLEVRDRLGTRTLRQHEVAVGLRRVRLLRGAPQVHETGVHRAGGVFDRALEQQVAARPRRVVILEGAEVEHLFVVAEVHGELVALGGLTGEQCLAAQAGVLAAERDRRRLDGRVAPEVRALERELTTCAGRAPAGRGSAGARHRRRGARRRRSRSVRCRANRSGRARSPRRARRARRACAGTMPRRRPRSSARRRSGSRRRHRRGRR